VVALPDASVSDILPQHRLCTTRARDGRTVASAEPRADVARTVAVPAVIGAVNIPDGLTACAYH
jgi:hypothetical protein